MEATTAMTIPVVRLVDGCGLLMEFDVVAQKYMTNCGNVLFAGNRHDFTHHELTIQVRRYTSSRINDGEREVVPRFEVQFWVGTRHVGVAYLCSWFEFHCQHDRYIMRWRYHKEDVVIRRMELKYELIATRPEIETEKVTA